jgi:hypothetical protein
MRLQWINLVHDMKRWWGLVNMVMKLQIPLKYEEFFEWLKN